MLAQDKARELEDNFGELAAEVVDEIISALNGYYISNDNVYWENVKEYL